MKGLVLPRALRMEATQLALEMLWSEPDIVIVKTIMKQYSVRDAVARKIIGEARALVNEEFKRIAAVAVVNGVLELQAVFRAAFRDRRYAAAVSAKKLQIEILTGTKLDKPGTFGEDRSEQDLSFYAMHGYWPEEKMVETSGEEVESSGEERDPLAALPPVGT